MAGDSREFGGGHLIGPDTEILGGVLPGRDHSIAVDFKENPEPYESAYAVLERSLPGASGCSALAIATEVHEIVRKELPFSEDTVRAILREEADTRGLVRTRQEDVIGLSRFFIDSERLEPGGICHHQTLFTGALIHLLQQRNGIGGKASVELVAPEVKHNSMHTWIRYTKDGERIIIDSAATFASVFLLDEDPLSDGRMYLRTEELREFIAEEDLEAPDRLRLERYGDS